MKNTYRIHEVSQLCGIGVDSLRYYEKLGILHPRRDVNGYRLYHLKDLYKLNIIRDLRQLHFSMPQIREYLDGQNLSQTLALLHRESALLQKEIDACCARRQVLEDRVAALEAARCRAVGRVEALTLPDRRCVLLSQRITRDEEMDFVVKKLQRQYEDMVPRLGDQVIGAFFDRDALRQGNCSTFSSVFFILPREAPDAEILLPAGTYLSCRYRGDYTQNVRCWQAITERAEKEGLTLCGDPFELYEIDNRDTMRPEEFLTEIQVRITRQDV